LNSTPTFARIERPSNDDPRGGGPGGGGEDDDDPRALIGETVVYVEPDAETGFTRVSVITIDRNGLMADIGSAFMSLGLNVKSAAIQTGDDGFVENAFVVHGADLGAIPVARWDDVRTRLKATCGRRGRGKPWMERESRLRELFSRIDARRRGFIAQEDLDLFAQSLRMPRAFVHDFVDEGDQSGDGKMSFEEFAAFVRSKEISLQASYESLQPDARGKIYGWRLKKNLRNMELRTGRYNTRKKIRRRGLQQMLKYVDDSAILTAADFRDMMILIPQGQLETVSPYFMKVGLDVGTRRLPIPDRRKDGSPWGHLLAGGLAGIASKTVSSPLNVVAVRAIASGELNGPRTVGDLARAMSKIARGPEGARGLFKGNMSNSVASAPGKAFDFFAYATYKRFLLKGEDREPTNLERLLAGSLAGMTSDTLLYPLEVVSTRVSMNLGKPSNVFATARAIAKAGGVRALYAGWGAAMVGVVPYAGISFGCYDMLSSAYRKRLGGETAGPLPTLCFGFASGLLASTLSFPLYNATVRLQSGTIPAGLVGTPGLVNVMTHVYKTGGAKALMNGWVPSCAKIVPQAGVSFFVYEIVKTWLDGEEDARDDASIED
jgi:solute carrier family 25 phosphate transporter 23/24/25/41